MLLEKRKQAIEEVDALHKVLGHADVTVGWRSTAHVHGNSPSHTLPAGCSLQANEELKSVLNQFFSGRVNDELYIPPAQTIRIVPDSRV